MTEVAIIREAEAATPAALADTLLAAYRHVLDDGDPSEIFNASLEFAKSRRLSSAAMARVLMVLRQRGEVSADALRGWIREGGDYLGERAQPELPDRVMNTEMQVHAATTAWEHRDLAATLRRWFDNLNQAFFAGELPPSAISIERDNRRVLGWYQYVRDGLGLKYRINVNALYVGRPLATTLETLLHEMVHEWEEVALGKSRGGSYHSRAFRDKAAQLFGVTIDNRGQPTAPLPHDSPFAVLLGKGGVCLDSADTGAPAGRALEIVLQRPASRSRLAKWTCGCTSVWASRGVDVSATCDRCHQAFRRAG